MGVIFNEKYEPWMDEVALEGFKAGKSITAICCTLDIARDTYYRWRDDKDHPFYQIAKKGEQISQAAWESIGMDGVVGNLEKFAGSTWQFTMKNRFREHYSDAAPKDLRDTLIEKLLDKV
jgi:hypothetical protein